ncbi:hypothetical protein C2S51_019457 [Perilla frutescens var. frutescens]|nr:hypothetical protein C2S51_019457 [Perilla frutescens var. frutescens]
MLMTLYKGPAVNILWYSHGGGHQSAANAATDQHWVTGTIMLLSCIVGWSAFFIVQNKTLEEYPAELSLTSLVCFMGVIEGGIVAVIMERRKSAWAIGFDSRLLAAAYSGIVCSGIAYYMQSVVNKARGPVLIGAAIIVVGLYSVVWGKSKERSASDKLGCAPELPVVDMKTSGNAAPDVDETAAKSKVSGKKSSRETEP